MLVVAHLGAHDRRCHGGGRSVVHGLTTTRRFDRKFANHLKPAPPHHAHLPDGYLRRRTGGRSGGVVAFVGETGARHAMGPLAPSLDRRRAAVERSAPARGVQKAQVAQRPRQGRVAASASASFGAATQSELAAHAGGSGLQLVTSPLREATKVPHVYAILDSSGLASLLEVYMTDAVTSCNHRSAPTTTAAYATTLAAATTSTTTVGVAKKLPPRCLCYSHRIVTCPQRWEGAWAVVAAVPAAPRSSPPMTSTSSYSGRKIRQNRHRSWGQ